MTLEDAHATPQAGSLFADVPRRLAAERLDAVLTLPGVRIERIVSTGQTTPAGEWFDQAWDEWVLVVAGTAEVLLEPEETPRRMTAGDYLFIPARRRHRVTFTDPAQPTIWLAIHMDGGRAEGSSAAIPPAPA